MPSILYPLINGHRYSWASIETVFNGLPILGIKSINYKDSLKAGMVYGSKPQPIGRTRGKYEASADFEMLRLEWENLQATLTANGLGGFGEGSFDIIVQYSELPSSPIVVTDTILGCRVEEVDKSNSDSTDPTIVKVSLSVMRILHNGQLMASPIGVGF